MTERPTYPLQSIGQLGFIIYEPDKGLRSVLRGVLYSAGAREIFSADELEKFAQIPRTIPIAMVLMNSMNQGLSSKLAFAIRKGQLPMDRRMPMIGYATSPTVAMVSNALLKWGMDEFLAVPVTGRSLLAKVRTSLTNPRPFIDTPEYCGPDNSSAVEVLKTLA